MLLYTLWTWIAGRCAPARTRSLHVNEAASPIRVQMNCQVNNSKIRTIERNGREHIVVPSFTLPFGVTMNRGLYPEEEIRKAYKSLEGTLAPAGHPVVNGEYVAAGTIEAINAYHIGGWNENVRLEGNRVAVDKIIDVEYAKQTEKGRAVLEAINKGEPIHTSTGIFLEREMTPNAKGYEWIARNMQMDHDAILIGEIGAATPAEGVGMMVNVADAVEPGGSALSADSYAARQKMLSDSAQAKWGTARAYAWVADFDEKKAIVVVDSESFAVGYSIAGSQVTWADDQQSVKSTTSWVVNKFLQFLGLGVNSGPSNTQQEPDEMTIEELQAALAAERQATVDAVNSAVKPVADRLDALEATMTANARAEEATKREAVKAKFGEEVASSLTGNALDSLYKQCKGAAPVVNGFQGNQDDDDAFNSAGLPE